MINWSEHRKHTFTFKCSNTAQGRIKACKAPNVGSWGAHQWWLRCVCTQACRCVRRVSVVGRAWVKPVNCDPVPFWEILMRDRECWRHKLDRCFFITFIKHNDFLKLTILFRSRLWWQISVKNDKIIFNCSLLFLVSYFSRAYSV